MMEKIFWLAMFSMLLTACKPNNKDVVKIPKSHEEQMSLMFPKPQKNIKTIGILLYDGFTTLDAMGPYQTLTEIMGTQVFFVGRKKGLIANMNGVKIQCDTAIDEVKQLDVLLIPGGFKETYLATKDTALLRWIKEIDKTTQYTTSVCTGAWILGATGLLNGKEATTHWFGKKMLADSFGAKIQDKRFVKAGKYWTSAGVSAGIDMSLALVNEIMGEKYTKAVMLDMEYDPQPPFVGGSEPKTDKEIVEGIRAMYNSGMEKVLRPDTGISKIAITNKKDPICNMPTKAGITDTALFAGKVIGFCSKGCKEEYLKNPKGYVVR